MSLRLKLANGYLRRFVRPSLKRVPGPVEARRRFERSARWLPVSTRGVRIAQERMEGPGGAFPVEWVSAAGAARRRIVLYLHGGAAVMGSPRTHRSVTVPLARACGARVLVPDYRLAPEHPAPAAAEDAVAAYTALIAAGYEARQIALAGDSSGGGLCFAVLARLRRLGFPSPGCIAAFSPWVDMTMTSDACRENGPRDAMLPIERAEEVVGYYAGGRAPDDPEVSPLFATYADPPPVLIQASRCEILRDDATAMAARLREAGGEVTLDLWDEPPHAWQFFAPFIPEAREALERAARFIVDRTGAP